ASQYPEALAAHRRAIELQERSGDLSRMGVSLHEIGMVLWNQGDRAAAADYLERAVAAFEKTVGEMHPSTSASLYVLGSVEIERGRLERADAVLRRALAIREEVLGPKHFSTVMALTWLGRLRAQQERLDEAEALLREALARGGVSENMLVTQTRLADVLER